MKTVAFVPIRLNSQRVEGKNLRLLGDKPLMTYLLESLVAARNIDEVYVYCSDESIKQYIPQGAKYLKRDAGLTLPLPPPASVPVAAASVPSPALVPSVCVGLPC